jgi:hypothetical protein
MLDVMTGRGQTTEDIFPERIGLFLFPAPPDPPCEPPRLLSDMYNWLCRLGQNDWSVKLTARHVLVLKTERFSSASRHSSLRIASSPRSLNL